MDDKSKYPHIFWNGYAQAIINKYNLKQTVKGEHHGPCPACGGTDRFWIKEYKGEVRVHCRQCNDWKAIYDEMIVDGVLPTLYERQKYASVAVNDTSDFVALEPYHVKKGIDLHGAVLDSMNLVVPIIDISGKRVNTQTITPEGGKKFKHGAPIDSCFGIVKGPLKGECYLAEGWATACSVAQCTGRPAVFCLNSGNLPKVAAVLQEKRPECTFIVAADNDDAGVKAAKETNLPYKAPRQAKWDWNDVMLNHGPAMVAKELKKIRKPKPLFVQLDQLEFKAPEWLIEGLLEKNTFAVCFGSPAAGKTFLVLDMALSIATGKTFHDHNVAKGTVFYIAGEGHNGFARRAAAWQKETQISLQKVPFFKSSRSVVMTDDTQVAELRDVIEEMSQQHGEPSLIVIDTLARALGAADENSAKEMGAFIRSVDELREDYDCTVLAVHHTGHSNKDRARGSSSLLGAADCEFMVDKWFDGDDNTKIEVKWTKMKDALMPEPLNFLHVPQELTGVDLTPTSSIALKKIADKKPAKKVGEDRIKMVLDVFYEMGGEAVIRSDLAKQCAKKYEKSVKTWNNVIKEMTQEIFLQKSSSKNNVLTLRRKD